MTSRDMAGEGGQCLTMREIAAPLDLRRAMSFTMPLTTVSAMQRLQPAGLGHVIVGLPYHN